MRPYIRTSLAIFTKDLRLELRTKETLSSVLVFSLATAFIFNFAFDPSPQTIPTLAPGIVWVAFIFTGTLGLNRHLVAEKDRGTLDGLLLAPVSREAIYAGKVLGAFMLMFSVEVLMVPAFMILYDFSLLDPWFALMAILATLGFAAVTTLFSAITVHTRAREVMLPVLLLPVALPLLIGAVAVTGSALEGGGGREATRWISLVIVFDAVFLVLSSLAFELVMED